MDTVTTIVTVGGVVTALAAGVKGLLDLKDIKNSSALVFLSLGLSITTFIALLFLLSKTPPYFSASRMDVKGVPRLLLDSDSAVPVAFANYSMREFPIENASVFSVPEPGTYVLSLSLVTSPPNGQTAGGTGVMAICQGPDTNNKKILAQASATTSGPGNWSASVVVPAFLDKDVKVWCEASHMGANVELTNIQFSVFSVSAYQLQIPQTSASSK